MRSVDVLRLGFGAATLAVPGHLLPREANTPVARVVTRVLGARYVAQSAIGVLGQRRWRPEVDAAVDLVHAVTMVALAGMSGKYRRAAFTSAGAAVAFALLDLGG